TPHTNTRPPTPPHSPYTTLFRSVRADDRVQTRAVGAERDHQLVPRPHQARPLRRLAREQRRLGVVARSLLGHPDPRVALSRLRRSEEHTSELQSLAYLVCRLLLG